MNIDKIIVLLVQHVIKSGFSSVDLILLFVLMLIVGIFFTLLLISLIEFLKKEGHRWRRILCLIGKHEEFHWAIPGRMLGYQPFVAVKYCIWCKRKMELMVQQGVEWPYMGHLYVTKVDRNHNHKMIIL